MIQKMIRQPSPIYLMKSLSKLQLELEIQIYCHYQVMPLHQEEQIKDQREKIFLSKQIEKRNKGKNNI